jgi:uncharacterized protein with ATP-grasp and redox domains
MPVCCCFITDINDLINLATTETDRANAMVRMTNTTLDGMYRLLETDVSTATGSRQRLSEEVRNNICYVKMSCELLEFVSETCSASVKQLANIIDFEISGDMFADN